LGLAAAEVGFFGGERASASSGAASDSVSFISVRQFGQTICGSVIVLVL